MKKKLALFSLFLIAGFILGVLSGLYFSKEYIINYTNKCLDINKECVQAYNDCVYKCGSWEETPYLIKDSENDTEQENEWNYSEYLYNGIGTDMNASWIIVNEGLTNRSLWSLNCSGYDNFTIDVILGNIVGQFFCNSTHAEYR